jgi:hypothetical protein
MTKIAFTRFFAVLTLLLREALALFWRLGFTAQRFAFIQLLLQLFNLVSEAPVLSFTLFLRFLLFPLFLILFHNSLPFLSGCLIIIAHRSRFGR